MSQLPGTGKRNADRSSPSFNTSYSGAHHEFLLAQMADTGNDRSGVIREIIQFYIDYKAKVDIAARRAIEESLLEREMSVAETMAINASEKKPVKAESRKPRRLTPAA